MATINISFDTVEKSWSVTKDGAEVPNCVGVSVYPDYDDRDEGRIEIMLREKDEADDMYTFTRIVASDSAEGRALKGAPESAAVAGFLVAGTGSEVERDVESYFERPAKKGRR